MSPQKAAELYRFHRLKIPMNISFKIFSSAGSDHWNIRVAPICNATLQQLREPRESQPGHYSCTEEATSGALWSCWRCSRSRVTERGWSHQPIHLHSWESSPALHPGFPSVQGNSVRLVEPFPSSTVPEQLLLLCVCKQQPENAASRMSRAG